MNSLNFLLKYQNLEFRKGTLFMILMCLVLLPSCVQEMDKWYEGDESVSKDVIEILDDYPECSAFVSLIDELNMRKILGEQALFTVYAPTNDYVNDFLGKNPSLEEKRNYVNGCFVSGIYYEYDIIKKYHDVIEKEKKQTNRAEHLFYKTRSEGVKVGRYLKIYTKEFFENQSDDFAFLYGKDGADYMVEDIAVSKDKRNIPAANGVVNVLEGKNPARYNLERTLLLDPEISIANEWYKKFRTVSMQGESSDPNVIVDTTSIISYSFPSAVNIADENVKAMLLVPTNKAIQDFYGKYFADLNAIPESIIGQQLAMFSCKEFFTKSGLDNSVLSDVRSTAGSFIKGFLPDYNEHIVSSISASNGVIYKMDKIIPSPLVSSLVGGVLFMAEEREWENWMYLIENTDIESFMFDPYEGAHPPMTVLLAPDTYWEQSAGQGDLTQQMYSAQMGMLFEDIRKTGGFKKKFYTTSKGDILFDPTLGEFGGFRGWAGDEIKLLSDHSVYENTQGSIYEVDGSLLALDIINKDAKGYLTSVWEVISSDSNYSKFKELCIKAKSELALDLPGFSYSVFIPCDDMIVLDPDTCTEEEAQEFVFEHISNFKVYTDGASDMIMNQNERQFKITGEWENWTIIDSKNVQHKCNLEKSNIQTGNGVVHELTSAFTYDSKL